MTKEDANIDNEIRLRESWVERFLISAKTSLGVGVIGLVVSIISLFLQNWAVATATIVATGALTVSAGVLRFYSKQVYERSQIEVEHAKRMAELARRNLLDSVEALHLFVHNVRDQVALVHTRTGQLLDELERDKDWTRFVQEFLRMRDNSLHLILNDLLRVFAPLLPPGAQPWAAIRLLTKKNGQVGIYETLLRTGSVNPDRHLRSEGIPEDQGLPSFLREQHRLGHGIVVLGVGRSPGIWKPMENDARGEDKNIIVGPVFLKSKEPSEMAMILFVNSPRENVFCEDHVPFMKCCTDTLSMWLCAVTALCPSVTMDAANGSKG